MGHPYAYQEPPHQHFSKSRATSGKLSASWNFFQRSQQNFAITDKIWVVFWAPEALNEFDEFLVRLIVCDKHQPPEKPAMFAYYVPVMCINMETIVMVSDQVNVVHNIKGK